MTRHWPHACGMRTPTRSRSDLPRCHHRHRCTDWLLERLDETLSRIHAFRDEREASGVRLREARRELAEGREGQESSTLTVQGAPQ